MSQSHSLPLLSASVRTTVEAYTALFQSVGGVLWRVDGRSGHLMSMGDGAEALFGYPPAFWLEDPWLWKRSLHPEDAPEVLERFAALLERGETFQAEYRIVRADGSLRWLRDTALRLETEVGPQILGVMLDVTLDHKAMQLEKSRNALLEDLARHAPIEEVLAGMMALAAFQQPGSFFSLSRLSGGFPEVYSAAPPWLKGSAQALEALLEALRESAMRSGVPLLWSALEPQRLFSPGHEVLGHWDAPLEALGSCGVGAVWVVPILSVSSEALAVLTVCRAQPEYPNHFQLELYETLRSLAALALESDALVRQLDRQARRDPLTGLSNRLALEERLSEVLACRAETREPFALLAIDLDGFKHVNDSLGHLHGDRLLEEVAVRLSQNLRAGDTLARVGGDEFLVLLPEVRQREDALRVAHKLLALLEAPYWLMGHTLRMSASIGVALYPQDGEDPQVLRSHADTALYRSKGAGKHTVTMFSPEMNREALERLSLEGELRYALEKGEMQLYYQPQVDFTGRIVALEALLRWHSAQLGPMAPDHFIPLAEETGLILELGHWVLCEACTQLARWRSLGHTHLRVCINVSPLQFVRPQFVDEVALALHSSALPPECLEIELTEGVVMRDLESSAATLSALRGLGVQVSVDDFGVGYSSLRYLQRLPMNRLKVDRSFVLEMTRDPASHSLVETILILAQRLGLATVAEGVETSEQARALRDLGCEHLQGYLYARPSSASVVQGWLEQGGVLEGSADGAGLASS